LELSVVWAVAIENRFPLVYVENDWVGPTALRPTIVDGAEPAIVENASSHRIPQPSLPIPLDDEEVVGKPEASYPPDI